MRLSRQFLANIATAASVAGLFLAYAGVIVTFYGIKGETDLDFLGRTFESANVGVALIALGAALILLNVHRISKRFVAAIVVGPVSYAHAKIVNAHLTQMIKREKLNFDEIRRPTTKESETVGLASKELEQETSPGEVYESSLAEHDASDESEEQIQSHLRTPDEVVPLPAKTVLRNDADLKILSSVPDPGLFVGREAELERLQVFFEGRGHHLAVLIGSEGIGKTALVARAVHECVKDLSLVFWHRFSEEERPTLDTLFLKLRTFFQGRGDQSLTGLLENPVATTRDKVDAVATALTKQNYSLIFDDLHLLFDRRHQIQHPGLYRFFAQLLQGGYPGLVVLVSRIEPVFEGWLVGAEAKVKLGRPEQEVSHELLRSLGYPSESRETLQRMHELALGNPGEMLLLAGLADSHVLDSLGDAGNRLDDFQDRLLELVAQQLEEAERGLLLVAITHQEPIPEEVFRYHLGERPEAILEPLRRLVERCVLSYDEKNETYRLHGLLRRYLVDTLEREAQVKTHAEAARYYERLPCSEDPTSYDRVLGQVEASYHFFRAGQYAEAAPFQLSQHFLGSHSGMGEPPRL